MYCEEYDDGSWVCWYDDGSSEAGDSEGNRVYKLASGEEGGSGGFDWNQFFANASQAAVGIAGSASRTGYYIPQNQPQTQYTGRNYGGAVSANVGASRGGIGAGLNISTNTLMLIVGGVLLFMLGTNRGRR